MSRADPTGLPDGGTVVISGIGVVSPLGNSAPAVAARYAAGETAIAPLEGVASGFGALVPDIPLEVVPAEARARGGRLDRLCRLFLSAAYLAVADARLEIPADDAARVGLAFGTGLGCLLTNAEYNRKLVEHGPAAASPRLFAYTVSSAAAGEVSIALGIKGPNLTAHQGVAAGLGALGYAYDAIRTGKADVMLAGGADALGEALVRGLADMRLLKARSAPTAFGETTPGLCPSEGAAVMVLERTDRAHARGARPWARLAGYAAGFEPTLTRRERDPAAVTATMQRALTAAGAAPAAIDLVVTSAHATAVDAVERAALATVFSSVSPVLLAPKVAWGECFAAHGPLAVALAAALMREPALLTRDARALALDTAGGVASATAEHRRAAAQRGAGDAEPGVRGPLAMVHTLCYSGPTVVLVLQPE